MRTVGYRRAIQIPFKKNRRRTVGILERTVGMPEPTPRGHFGSPGRSHCAPGFQSTLWPHWGSRAPFVCLPEFQSPHGPFDPPLVPHMLPWPS